MPPDPAPPRFAAAPQCALFVLGVLALACWPWLDRIEALPFWWRRLGPVLATAIVAGLLEAAAARRSGRRRWLGAWLPPVLGMLAYFLVREARWRWEYGPGAPDTGLALGLTLLGFGLGIPLFALLVHGIAAVALLARGKPGLG